MAGTIDDIPFHGLRFDGERYDCGNRLGFIEANIAFGLNREDLKDRLQEIIGQFGSK